MARPIWKGFLSFGLVMIPVSLASAEATEHELSFNMLDRRDHSRIKYLRVSESSGKEVAWKDIVKGYDLGNGKYVEVTPEDFKRAAPKATRTIEIVGFVRAGEIPPLFFERPFALEPQDGGEKGYNLLREALAETGMVGIAKMVLHTRQHLAALIPDGPLLTICTMRFADELREPDQFELASKASHAKINKGEMQMATTLIKSMSMDWDPKSFHDEYRDKLRDWIKQRAKSGVSAPPPEEEEEEVPATYSIMDLLKKSVEETKRPAKSRGESHPRSHARRKAG